MRGMILGGCLCLMTAVAGAAVAAPAPQPQAVNAGLLQLHDDLRLSADQEAAWRDYASAIAPNPQFQARHRATAQLLPQLATPRRIALMEATTAQDQADFQRQGAAVLAFYGQLTPAQQRTFDAETAPTGGNGPAQGR